jgi:hypothetical protein
MRVITVRRMPLLWISNQKLSEQRSCPAVPRRGPEAGDPRIYDYSQLEHHFTADTSRGNNYRSLQGASEHFSHDFSRAVKPSCPVVPRRSHEAEDPRTFIIVCGKVQNGTSYFFTGTSSVPAGNRSIPMPASPRQPAGCGGRYRDRGAP